MKTYFIHYSKQYYDVRAPHEDRIVIPTDVVIETMKDIERLVIKAIGTNEYIIKILNISQL